MGDRRLSRSTRRFILTLVLVGLLSSTVTAVAIQTLTFNPIVAGSGPLQESGDIVLEDQDLVYSGTKVDGVDVTLNNTASSPHDVDVHVAIRDDTGSVLVEKTVSTSIGGETVKTVNVDFARENEPHVNDVDKVETTLEVTG